MTFFFIGLIKVIDFCLYQLFGEITAEFEHPKPDPIGKPSMSTEDTKSDEMIFPSCVPFESTALKKTSSQPEETCSTYDACNNLIKEESGNKSINPEVRKPVIQLEPESPLAENLNPETSIPTEKKKNNIGSFIKRIFSISTGPKIFQNFVIKEKKIKMLIDSGSIVSFLKKKRMEADREA